MPKLLQLKQLISRCDGDELIEKGLLLTLISDIEKDLDAITKDIQICCGTNTNKPALIVKLERLHISKDSENEIKR